jgi:hypothetical protein
MPICLLAQVLSAKPEASDAHKGRRKTWGQLRQAASIPEMSVDLVELPEVTELMIGYQKRN